jgi:hypothetical protein
VSEEDVAFNGGFVPDVTLAITLMPAPEGKIIELFSARDHIPSHLPPYTSAERHTTGAGGHFAAEVLTKDLQQCTLLGLSYGFSTIILSRFLQPS